MTTAVARTTEGWWVVSNGQANLVATDAATTRDLLADRAAIDAATRSGMTTVALADLELLSPVTAPCRVVAQLANYRSHAQESGLDPATLLPTFFRKSSASITGPTADIVKPAHVRLLDYEIELGLVIGAPMSIGTRVTDADLPDLVAGIVVTNDVSARDVQLSKGQFFESKSYPTFTPVGPLLVLLDREDFVRLPNLRLQLSVNGVLRQDRSLTDMIVGPAQALSILSGFQPLEPGDLLLTGTPGGTALKAPPKIVEKAAALLPPAIKWRIFFDKQAKVDAYLKAGDVITARVSSSDGAFDLGTQRSTVADGPRAD